MTVAVRVAAQAAAAAVAAVAVLAIAAGGPDYFLQLGDRSHNLEYAREVLGSDVATPLADGHDGENFWVLARDPFLREDGAASRFDRPAYRAQRIGYPMLGALWRVGGEWALLWGLVVTNVAAVAIGTWATARLALRQGSSPLLGYAFPLNPLVLIALVFDFADAVALACTVCALLAAVSGRGRLLAAASVAAALAKESSLFALGAAALVGRDLSWRHRAALVVPGALAALGWRLYVVSRPGFGGDPQVQEFELTPFRGVFDVLTRGLEAGEWFDTTVAGALIVAAAWVLLSWWRGARSPVMAAALGVAALAPFLSAQVLSLWTNSLRALGPLITLAVVGLAPRRP